MTVGDSLQVHSCGREETQEEKRRIIGCKSVPRKNNTGNCLMRGGDRVVEEDKLSFLKATFIRSSRPDKRMPRGGNVIR